jgi:hypothetical protein
MTASFHIASPIPMNEWMIRSVAARTLMQRNTDQQKGRPEAAFGIP